MEHPRPSKPDRALTADFVRVALFLGVVLTHCVTTINYTPDVIRQAGLASALLHITRYGFVAITLFVLVLSMRGRTMTPMEFWRRRFGLVVAPYLVWTLVYSISDPLLRSDREFDSVGQFFLDFGRTIFTGDAKYQLYFLLISMQIYLAFPALMWLWGRVGGRPWLVLGAAAVVQFAVFAVYQKTTRPGSAPWENIYAHQWKLLPMYTLFIVIGIVAAGYHEEVSAWLRRHAIALTACGVAAAAFGVSAYLRATAPEYVPEAATTAWNPRYLPWYVAGFVLLFVAATLWDGLRASGRAVGERAVTYATVRAFGVFVVHPLVLDVLEHVGFFELLASWIPGAAVRTLVLTAVVVTVSLLFVDLVLRTPVSRWVVGRERISAAS